jgi:ABC-type transport system substrate-binding protein
MAWNADYPDAENFLQLFYGPNASPGPNNSNFNHPEFNKLYAQAAVMPDTPARSAIYNKMVDILVEEVPWIFGVHRKDYYPYHGWFKNYKRSGMILNYSKYYRIDQEAKERLKKSL